MLQGFEQFLAKTSVKIHHVQKSLQILDSVQPGKIKHDLQAVLKGGDGSDQSPNDHSPNDHSPNDHSPNDHSPNDHSPNNHSPIDHSPNDHSLNNHSPNDHSLNDQSSEQLKCHHSPNATISRTTILRMQYILGSVPVFHKAITSVSWIWINKDPTLWPDLDSKPKPDPKLNLSRIQNFGRIRNFDWFRIQNFGRIWNRN
jgi:hypothetical protein